MRSFTAVIERCPDTGLFVGDVPEFPGAHSQGETLDELQHNLKECSGCCWKTVISNWNPSLSARRPSR